MRRLIGTTYFHQPKPPTRLESVMHQKTKKELESRASEIREGVIDIKPGKYRDKSFDPDIPKVFH